MTFWKAETVINTGIFIKFVYQDFCSLQISVCCSDVSQKLVSAVTAWSSPVSHCTERTVAGLFIAQPALTSYFPLSCSRFDSCCVGLFVCLSCIVLSISLCFAEYVYEIAKLSKPLLIHQDICLIRLLVTRDKNDFLRQNEHVSARRRDSVTSRRGDAERWPAPVWQRPRVGVEAEVLMLNESHTNPDQFFSLI